MMLNGTQIGYSLGHFPIPLGRGECQRPSCTRDAIRLLVMLLPCHKEEIARCDWLFVNLCLACAAEADRVIDGPHEPQEIAAARC